MVLLPRKSPQLLLSHFALFLFFSQVLFFYLLSPCHISLRSLLLLCFCHPFFRVTLSSILGRVLFVPDVRLMESFFRIAWICCRSEITNPKITPSLLFYSISHNLMCTKSKVHSTFLIYMSIIMTQSHVLMITLTKTHFLACWKNTCTALI